MQRGPLQQPSRVLFDTPTPPSQSYSSQLQQQPEQHQLQTSLKPRFNGAAAAAAAAPTPFRSKAAATSTPAGGLLAAIRAKSKLDREMDIDLDSNSEMDSTFTTSDFGGAGAGEVGNKSTGLGNYGHGLGMGDRQRFADLHAQQSRRRAATRVDEHSDAGTATTGGSSSGEDDLVARLGMGVRQGRQPHQNVSKSAFDGMARELRREFERIMDSGKKPVPVTVTASPHQARHTSQVLSNPTVTASTALPLPRGVPPPSKQQQQSHQRASPARQRTAYAPHSAQMDRRDSTPTTVRTFGQELHAPRQQQQHQQIPSPRFAVSPKTALKQPRPAQQQAYEAPPAAYAPAVSYATSPFQVSSVAAAGVLPPNNTRASAATAKSSSPLLSQQLHQHDAFAPAPAPAVRITASASSSPYHVRVPDITGLTEGLTSPSRIASGPSSHRELPKDRSRTTSLGRSQEDPALSAALVGLRQRLEALESENARSEAKVAELEDKLASRAADPAFARSSREDDLVLALRAEIERLQGSIEEHALALVTLQDQQRQQPVNTQPAYAYQTRSGAQPEQQAWQAEFLSLREALAQLSDQVAEVKKVLEEVLDSLRSSPVHPKDHELLRPLGHVRQDSLRDRVRPSSPGTPSRRSRAAPGLAMRSPPRQHLHAQLGRHHSEPPYYVHPAHGLSAPQMQRATAAEHQQQHQHRAYSAPLPQAHAPAPNVAYRVQRPSARPTFAEHNEPLLDRAERILANLPPRVGDHASTTCEVCKRREEADQRVEQQAFESSHHYPRQRQASKQQPKERDELPMQTVISRALRELEDDFAVHKRIYVELSEEYKLMDPASPDVGKRKILAEHLKESIDVLELKADEIKRLYDLLHYRGEMARERQQSGTGHRL